MVALLLIGVERFCFRQTAGFRESKILSSLPSDPRWALPILSVEKRKEIQALLDQPYSYIGHGGTCYCFESKDKKNILKFLKHQHMNPVHWSEKIPLPEALVPLRQKHVLAWKEKLAHKQPEFLFTSFLIAYQELKEETGLIHIQINKDDPFTQEVTLYDKIGAKHSISLKDTEFVLQKKAELLFPHLGALTKTHATEEIKQSIHSIIALLLKRYEKGISDRDPNLLINFGFIEGTAIEIDIGSFTKREKDPTHFLQDLYTDTEQLKGWLEKNSPSLTDYLDQEIQRQTSYAKKTPPSV